MTDDEETSPWSPARADGAAIDPQATPPAGDPRAEAAMMLFETYISRYRAQVRELLRDRR